MVPSGISALPQLPFRKNHHTIYEYMTTFICSFALRGRNVLSQTYIKTSINYDSRTEHRMTWASWHGGFQKHTPCSYDSGFQAGDGRSSKKLPWCNWRLPFCWGSSGKTQVASCVCTELQAQCMLKR